MTKMSNGTNANEIMREALWTIRTAGLNENPTSQWMQEWAAYGLEPHKWDRPSENPPVALSKKPTEGKQTS